MSLLRNKKSKLKQKENRRSGFSNLRGGEKTMFFLTKRTAPSEGESIFYCEIKSKQTHVKLLKKGNEAVVHNLTKKSKGFPPPLSKKKKKKYRHG